MNQCVYCSTTDNLNTQFNITLDEGQKITVHICDVHAEDATIKTAKEAYLGKQQQIAEFLKQAQALGLQLVPSGQLIVAKEIKPAATQPSAPVRPTPASAATNLSPDDPGVVSTAKLDSRKMTSVGGAAGASTVESYGSYDLASQDQMTPGLRDGLAKLDIVEGRAGQPIAVPVQRVDGTGVTRVSVRKTETDQTLQHRFKKMADESLQDRMPDFVRSGYKDSIRDCPICHGTCTVRGETCPKCKGIGTISVY